MCSHPNKDVVDLTNSSDDGSPPPKRRRKSPKKRNKKCAASAGPSSSNGVIEPPTRASAPPGAVPARRWHEAQVAAGLNSPAAPSIAFQQPGPQTTLAATAGGAAVPAHEDRVPAYHITMILNPEPEEAVRSPDTAVAAQEKATPPPLASMTINDGSTTVTNIVAPVQQTAAAGYIQIPADETTKDAPGHPVDSPMQFYAAVDLIRSPSPLSLAPVRPSQAPTSTPPGTQAVNAAATAPLSPPPTQQQIKDVRPLSSHPNVAARFVPVTSTADGFDVRNPHAFCMKPAFWQSWSGARYARFATWLLNTIDASDFALMENIPVEEVQQVFSTLVTKPLYDAREAMKRGEEGMREMFEFHAKEGTQARMWRQGVAGQKAFRGEIQGVDKGIVKVIVCHEGSLRGLPVRELGVEDKKYLKTVLRKEEWRMVFGGKEGAKVRTWRENVAPNQPFRGQFEDVGKDVVNVVMGNGTVVGITIGQLSDQDMSYLRGTLKEEERRVLFAPKGTEAALRVA